MAAPNLGASTSQRTFYEHFKNKEDAIVAALDSGSAHMLAAALPAFRRAPDWPHAVHDIQEAMFCFGAERARVRQARLLARLRAETQTPPIAAEVIGGALYSSRRGCDIDPTPAW